jgi:hypothetical protein
MSTYFQFSGQQAVKIYGKNNLLMNDIAPRDLRVFASIILHSISQKVGLPWNFAK